MRAVTPESQAIPVVLADSVRQLGTLPNVLRRDEIAERQLRLRRGGPVLAIESSCDDSAAAVVSETGAVLSSVVASQVESHAPYGGVVPELAARQHLGNLPWVIEEALRRADCRLNQIGLVAVTTNPGLQGALLVGTQVARTLAWELECPMYGVNHLHSHIFSAFLAGSTNLLPQPQFPFVALLASGGHTALYRVQSLGEVILIGQTRDDAAGEAFDKVAQLLDLGYPGGPAIERAAALCGPSEWTAPEFERYRRLFAQPFMRRRHSFEFSFSGVKTAVSRVVAREAIPQDRKRVSMCAAAFQESMIEALASRALAACEQLRISRLVLAGGVSSNQALARRLLADAANAKVSVHLAPKEFRTDNAAMVGFFGLLLRAAGDPGQSALQTEVRARDFERRRGPYTGL